MKNTGTLLAAGALAAVSAHDAEAAETVLEPAFQAITGYTFGGSRAPLVVISDLVKASKKDPAKRTAIERQLVALLKSPDATYDCKDFVCRQLWVLGTREAIPVLASMLTDEKYSDMARYALERNTAPEAGKALLDALGKASGLARIGIVNSLGARKDAVAVPLMEKVVAGGDDEQAAAAVMALSKIGGPKATTVITRASTTGGTKTRSAADLAIRVLTNKPAPRKKAM